MAHSSPLIEQARFGKSLGCHEPRLVLELGQAKRVGQAPRGIDGHHRDLGPRGRHAQRDRRRCRRLAHAARASADANALVGQERRQRSQRRLQRGRQGLELRALRAVTEQVGQLDRSARHALHKAVELLALGLGPGVLGQRRAQRAARHG